MSIKQTLYNIKKKFIANNTPKRTFNENEKVAVIEGADISSYENSNGYTLVNSLDVIAEKDYNKIEIYMGAPDKTLLKKMTTLRFLQLSSAGLNGYDNPALYEKMPEIKTAKGIYGKPISECVIGDILFLMKPALSNTVNKKHSIPPLSGKEFEGSTILMCGLGDIGLNIAERCKGMKCACVLGVDSYNPQNPSIDSVYPLSEIKNLVGKADVVISALPQLPETDRIFNKEMFSEMKDEAVFINVGRGNAVDQKALFDAVNSGKLFGAALDVTTPDPLPKNSPLRKSKRILITDHLACISRNNKKRLQAFYKNQFENLR